MVSLYIRAARQVGGDDTMDLLPMLIILALIGTGVSMALGLLAMSGGGASDRLFSTRLMWTRVGSQALIRLLLVIAGVRRQRIHPTSRHTSSRTVRWIVLNV